MQQEHEKVTNYYVFNMLFFFQTIAATFIIKKDIEIGYYKNTDYPLYPRMPIHIRTYPRIGPAYKMNNMIGSNQGRQGTSQWRRKWKWWPIYMAWNPTLSIFHEILIFWRQVVIHDGFWKWQVWGHFVIGICEWVWWSPKQGYYVLDSSTLASFVSRWCHSGHPSMGLPKKASTAMVNIGSTWMRI